MTQQQKNQAFDDVILYVAGLFDRTNTSLDFNKAAEHNVNLVFEAFCVPHPVEKNTLWPLYLIMKDLSRRRWPYKKRAVWLKSLVYEGKQLVPIS